MKFIKDLFKEYGLILFASFLSFSVLAVFNHLGYFNINTISSNNFNKSILKSAQKNNIVSQNTSPNKNATNLRFSMYAFAVALAEHPRQSVIMERAEQIADFSNIPNDYNVIKALNLMGMKGVIAEHKTSKQYMAIVDTGTVLNITKNDLQTGRIIDKLQNYGQQILPPNIKVSRLEIIPQGSIYAFDQSVPVAEMKIKLEGINSKRTYKGLIGIVSNTETNKNNIIFSMDEKGRFNEEIAENFYKSVRIQ